MSDPLDDALRRQDANMVRATEVAQENRRMIDSFLSRADGRTPFEDGTYFLGNLSPRYDLPPELSFNSDYWHLDGVGTLWRVTRESYDPYGQPKYSEPRQVDLSQIGTSVLADALAGVLRRLATSESTFPVRNGRT